MDYLKSLLLITMVGLVLSGCNLGNKDWRTASRESARIAPDPAETSDAIIHVYGADAWGWRGWFAIHTWIALKRTDEDVYTIYDVVGWRGFNGQQVMRIRPDIPIILCTGFSEAITEEEAKALGIRKYILKPILKDKLALAISRVLYEDKHRRKRE